MEFDPGWIDKSSVFFGDGFSNFNYESICTAVAFYNIVFDYPEPKYGFVPLDVFEILNKLKDSDKFMNTKWFGVERLPVHENEYFFKQHYDFVGTFESSPKVVDRYYLTNGCDIIRFSATSSHYQPGDRLEMFMNGIDGRLTLLGMVAPVQMLILKADKEGDFSLLTCLVTNLRPLSRPIVKGDTFHVCSSGKLGAIVNEDASKCMTLVFPVGKYDRPRD